MIAPPIDTDIFDQLIIARQVEGSTFELLSDVEITALKVAYEQAITADLASAPLEFRAQQVAFFEQHGLLLHELRAVQAQRQLLSNQVRTLGAKARQIQRRFSDK